MILALHKPQNTCVVGEEILENHKTTSADTRSKEYKTGYRTEFTKPKYLVQWEVEVLLKVASVPMGGNQCTSAIPRHKMVEQNHTPPTSLNL